MSCQSGVSIRALLACAAAAGALAVSACGGGGTNSTPPPPTASPELPAPPPPPPTPAMTPASTFETAEYYRSDGPEGHKAIAAWQRGATGRNVTIAVIDTGIDGDNPEFAGRISAASTSVAGNGTYEAEDDHGTNVALVAAAARNNSGVMGIAYEATIQALRADAPGSCASETADDPESGCRFPDDAIATGVGRAIAAGARVINLSLGGDAPNANLRNALASAASAGIVVVVAAGNDGASTETGVSPNNPDPFAAGLRAAGNGNVIVAGSVNATDGFSAFSNRAGSEAQWFLSAQGERICCVYEDGTTKVGTNAQGQQVVYLFSGTSFAAPQISGAAALLAQAFPNLSGVQIVDLLLRTARDAGPAGTDPTYGRGVLDIERAFAPQGTTTLAGTTTAVVIGDSTGVTSPAMGDAGATAAPLGVVILDGFSRPYGLDLAAGIRAAQVQQKLLPALSSSVRSHTMGSDSTAIAFSIDGRSARPWIAPLRIAGEEAASARVLAASVATRVAPGKQVAFAFRQGADGLAAQLQGRREPAFLIAGSPANDIGTPMADRLALAYRQSLGATGVTFNAEQGRVSPGWADSATTVRGVRPSEPVRRLGITADRSFGQLDAALGLSWLAENRTVLGARFHDSLGGGGANSLFADARIAMRPADGWHIGAALRQGFTRVPTRGAATGGTLTSRAFAIDVERHGVFQTADRLGLRLAQPLRVERGGLNLHLPVDYDYASGQTVFGSRAISLTPHGRELIGELSWRGSLGDGALAASLYYRRDPGHYASLPDDQGAAISWTRQF